MRFVSSSGKDQSTLEEKINTKTYAYKVKSIEPINSNSFIVHEKVTNNLRLLTVNYQGNSNY